MYLFTQLFIIDFLDFAAQMLHVFLIDVILQKEAGLK